MVENYKKWFTVCAGLASLGEVASTADDMRPLPCCVVGVRKQQLHNRDSAAGGLLDLLRRLWVWFIFKIDYPPYCRLF